MSLVDDMLRGAVSCAVGCANCRASMVDGFAGSAIKLGHASGAVGVESAVSLFNFVPFA